MVRRGSLSIPQSHFPNNTTNYDTQYHHFFLSVAPYVSRNTPCIPNVILAGGIPNGLDYHDPILLHQ